MCKHQKTLKPKARGQAWRKRERKRVRIKTAWVMMWGREPVKYVRGQIEESWRIIETETIIRLEQPGVRSTKVNRERERRRDRERKHIINDESNILSRNSIFPLNKLMTTVCSTWLQWWEVGKCSESHGVCTVHLGECHREKRARVELWRSEISEDQPHPGQ